MHRVAYQSRREIGIRCVGHPRGTTMSGPALAYAYRYPHASTLEGNASGANLRLATWSGAGRAASPLL